VLVLGLESGVRGILGFETKGVSYCGLTTEGLTCWEEATLPSSSLGFVSFLVLEGLSSVVGLEPCLDLDEVDGLLCCSGFGLTVVVVGLEVFSLIVSTALAPGVVGLVRG